MKNKGEKGSVTVLIIVVCTFILVTLTMLVMNLQNRMKTQDRQINQITKQYQVTEQDLEDAYIKNQ